VASFDPISSGKAKAILDTPTEFSSDAKVIRYTKPAMQRPKHIVLLCRTSSMFSTVQVISPGGGENKLHSHSNLDGFWFVLRGRVRFYTTDDEVIAELGPEEAVSIPHNYPYWFENIGETDVELLQVESLLNAGETVQRTLHAGEEVEENFDVSEV